MLKRSFWLAVVLAAGSILLLAGCLSGDQAPRPAEEAQPAATEESKLVEWEDAKETEIGCVLGAGHYAGGAYSYACRYQAESLEPCTEIHLPERTSALSVTVVPSLVDPERPGAGEYAIAVWGPPDEDWKRTWSAPLGAVEYQVKDPEPGTWGVNAVPQGATFDQAWGVTLEAIGTAAPGDLPTLEPNTCIE